MAALGRKPTLTTVVFASRRSRRAATAFMTLIVAANAHLPKALLATTIVVASEAKTTKKATFVTTEALAKSP